MCWLLMHAYNVNMPWSVFCNHQPVRVAYTYEYGDTYEYVTVANEECLE